jgi:hypothetical protein
MKKKGVPTKQRKYLLRIKEDLKRGILTFEYLERRTALKPCRKLTKSVGGASKTAKKDGDKKAAEKKK